MKKVFALCLILLFCRPCFSQVIKSFEHPAGYGLSAPAVHLLNSGYLVTSQFNDGTAPVNYISRYRADGTSAWTRTENSGLLSGIMDMAENSLGELYLLADDLNGDGYYGLIKTDTIGNTLWSVNLDKNTFSSYEAPKVRVNNAGDVYVMSSTYDKTHIYKLNNNGDLLWSKTIEVDTVMTKNPAFGLLTTQDGGLIFAGKARDDVFMVRLAADGTVVWTKRLFDHENSYAHPKAIVQLQDGNFLVAGFRGESTGDYSTGLFLLKMDGNGTVLNHRFYSDSLAQYAFIPYAMEQMPNGEIRVMGCGGMLSFADFDVNLQLEHYTVWNALDNLQVSAGGFDYRNGQSLVTGTDNNTVQYILRDLSAQSDLCNQQYITSLVQENLPIDNTQYATEAIVTKGPVASPAAYTLSVTNSFTTYQVCGQPEWVLHVVETQEPVSVNVYPNPVSAGQPLQLEISGDEAALATLVNASGKVVLQQNIQGQQQINTGTLPAGLYFLSLSVNEKTPFTTKIIVY